jgi:DNA primase
MSQNYLNDFISQCHSNLLNASSNEVRSAQLYLSKDRSIDEDSWKTHRVGYCPSDAFLHSSIKYLGSDEDNKWSIQRYVKGRLIVPIFSEFGDIVAFATKVPTMEAGNPWWNTKFIKSNHLFLLDKARYSVFNKNKIYIVEGYIDALMLYQSGLRNVVAVMGTATTVRKIALIARYCNNVCLCFDSDKNGSGDNAKNAMIAILNKYSFCDEISTIDSLPIGKDPANFVQENGLKAFIDLERKLSEKEILKISIDYANKSR